jgi:hypothetical protein
VCQPRNQDTHDEDCVLGAGSLTTVNRDSGAATNRRHLQFHRGGVVSTLSMLGEREDIREHTDSCVIREQSAK